MTLKIYFVVGPLEVTDNNDVYLEMDYTIPVAYCTHKFLYYMQTHIPSAQSSNSPFFTVPFP